MRRALARFVEPALFVLGERHGSFSHPGPLLDTTALLPTTDRGYHADEIRYTQRDSEG